MSTEKPRYISNRELLLEIAKSKVSFCWFENPEKHARYDLIVQRLTDITPEVIEAAKAKRAAFLSTKTAPVAASSINTTDLVFRVMTSEHIPEDPLRKRRGGDPNVPMVAKTNFPSFKHYMMKGKSLIEVGRSHWSGGTPPTGSFSLEQGKMTRRLADMLMLLVERYSLRANWRGYCVDEETEALTQRGWLRHDQITEADTILSFDGATLRWSPVRSIFRDQYDGLMFRMTVCGMDAFVTPGHKFVTEEGLVPVEFLREKDKVLLTGAPLSDPEETLPDAFVEMVGWAATEGSIYESADRNYPRIDIYQNEGPKAVRIRKALQSLDARYSEHLKGKNICFHLTKELCLRLANVLGEGKAPTMPFLLSLTQRQRMLLIETMVDGDGFRHAPHLLRYVQKSVPHVDAFVALCSMAGLRTSVKRRDTIAFGKASHIYQVTIISKRGARHTMVENIDLHGGKRHGARKGVGKATHPNEPTVPFKGVVWCPQTDFGCFMARRNGYAYLTGNTYVDEMKSHALLQLSQIALQFDESKSENPFAFYTTSIRNCFTRVLNLEKRNQHIRDDLLIMAGARPSYARQIADEEMQRAQAAVAERAQTPSDDSDAEGA